MTNPAHDTLITQVSALVEQRIGVNIRAQFGSELATILYDIAQGDLPALLVDLRRTSESAPAWQALLRALTIGETYFLRDAAYFQRLRVHLLPGLAAAHRQQGHYELHLWSAGCATGEEAYSLAITLYETLPDFPRWNIHLYATDMNSHALEHARRGIYRDWAFRHTPAGFQQRYFTAVPGGWQIAPFIREMVTFEEGNLLYYNTVSRFDIVFCRNVLLYFGGTHAQQLEQVLYDALKPGGWLVLGQSEIIRHSRALWQTSAVGHLTLYQKPAPGQPNRQPSPRSLSRVKETPIMNPELYPAAVDALYADNAGEAERLLRALLAQEPAHAPANILLASVLANRHALNQAHQHLDTALQANPLLADAHYLRAILFLEEEQEGLARQALRSALYCQRNHVLAAFLLGTFYARDGDTARAVREWETARQAVAALPADERISDLSDMTAAAFAQLIDSQLESLKYA